MNRVIRTTAILAALLLGAHLGAGAAQAAGPRALDRHDGYVDANGVMIYYVSIGSGPPLMILHGGPGATHDYFLPHLLPLAAHHRLVLIDERGSGRSQRLPAPYAYTLPGLVSDVEAVRAALSLGKIDLLGHSFGGILAQAYAIAHPDRLRRLVLAGTGSSAARIDADFAEIKAKLDPELRKKIEALEASGIFEKSGAQLPEYRKLADEAEAPYSYFRRPPPWDPAGSPMGWDVLRELWVTRSDFEVGGYLKGFDFTPQLREVKVPTLIIYGDHDLVSRATVQETHDALPHAALVEMANSAHETFVDDPERFLSCVSSFLDGPLNTSNPCG